MRSRPRTCQSYASTKNIRHFDSDRSLSARSQQSLWINGYTTWIADLVADGREPYFLSFMFHSLPGTQHSRLEQMRREIDRLYCTLVNHCERNPRSTAAHARLPVLIAYPDLPVAKSTKRSLAEVSINAGLHYHGVIALHPMSRLTFGLERHFAERQAIYASSNTVLYRVHVTPVTAEGPELTSYLFKHLSRGSFSHDEVLIFPKARKEL